MKVACVATALVVRSLPEVSLSTDTGKRFHQGQIAEVWGDSIDKKWLYVDAPAARGWVSRGYVAVVSDTELVSAGWPSIPVGLEEIKRIFGEPGKAICGAGRVRLPAPLKLSWVNQTVTVVACHKLLEDVFESVFNAIYAAGLWDELENFGGIYEPRTVTSSQKISTHAWGIAGDFDTIDNALGKPPKMHPKIVRIFEDHGFQWGGTWTRPDGMHFQRCRGY